MVSVVVVTAVVVVVAVAIVRTKRQRFEKCTQRAEIKILCRALAFAALPIHGVLFEIEKLTGPIPVLLATHNTWRSNSRNGTQATRAVRWGW